MSNAVATDHIANVACDIETMMRLDATAEEAADGKGAAAMTDSRTPRRAVFGSGARVRERAVEAHVFLATSGACTCVSGGLITRERGGR